ncbi:Potassium voltage-gated channel subfamily H member 2 (Ether-a-go-go-related gene potassium channel 1) (ERG-1) (Eag-related protein 1) (Ether-a-go-go-related protein 1) (MERG) (Voltage-gated potassium channel subunit Kv11.1) [Durusdinium trenchii]|uniref:Ion transport domain-containing protein n=1 Tax=Durusdinium trenchii TaxID=1381693 RepID=A0ABP0J034_9DINO
MMRDSHGGDDFFDLIRRLGDCYVNDLKLGGHLSNSADTHTYAMGRKSSRDDGHRPVSRAFLPVQPPSTSKSLPRPGAGPDLLPAIADWKRQISGHSNVSSKSRSVSGRYDACFADDFKKALQRKVTFEISEVKASGSVASDGLEAITRSQPLAAFEPREFWKRQGSANPLTASVKNRMSLKSSNVTWSQQEQRASWSSVIPGGCSVNNMVVHPTNKFKSLWSVLGMMFLIFDIIVIPLRFFNLPDWWSFADAMNVVTLCYWNMDILVSFFTGYYHRGILVMKPRRIAVHYLRTWFLMDVTVVTVDWILTALASQQEGTGAAGVVRLSKTLRLLRFVRLMRMFRLLRGNTLLQRMEENTFSQATLTQYNILKIVGYIILLQHVIACLWFFVGTSETGEASWIEVTQLRTATVQFQYFSCLHWSFTQLGVGNVEIDAYNVFERLFCVCVALVSLISSSALVSTITSLMTTLEQRRNDEMNQFTRLRRFLQYNGISGDLKDRVTRFLQYAYHSQTECTSDSDVPILKLLSTGLHAELQFSRYEGALSKLTFLKSLMASNFQTFQENKVLQSLAVKALHMVELAQNDVVFCTGGIAECSYLVLSGQFSYVKLAKQYPAGGHHWIGDYCLWTPWLYMGELLAREIGRLVALEAEAFCECVGAVWEMRQQAMFFAQMVVEELNNLQLEDLTDVKMDEDEEEEVEPKRSRRESNLTLESLSSVKFLRCCCRYRSSVATSRSSTPLNSVSPVNPGVDFTPKPSDARSED